MVPFLFHNEQVQLSPCGALWWPSERALLVADLHLEKARFFAANGQFLPPFDSVQTLSGLAALIDRLRPQKLICLGDSFHDRRGAVEIAGKALDLLRELAGRTRWIWISGNHDEDAHFAVGSAVAELAVSGIALRHEAVEGSTEPEISGHFHPKIRLRHKGHQVARRCFLTNGHKLIMPAYGALTGGLDVDHPAIRAAMGSSFTALVPGEERLLRFPVEGMERCA